jgi:hypothetical protein
MLLNNARPLWLVLLLFQMATGALPLWSATASSSTSVTLAWDPNPESDIATYILQYGTSSGDYSSSVEVGNTTSSTIRQLQYGATYFFVVRARNGAGLESPPSNEVSFTVPPAITFPGISDGEAFNSGNSIELAATVAEPFDRIVFRVGDQQIGEARGGFPNVIWSNAPEGEHIITAEAYRSEGDLIGSVGITVRVVVPSTEGMQELPDGSVEFTITGAPGRTQHVYTSTDLQEWELMASILNETGAVLFTDEEVATQRRRFYRVASE